MNDNKHESETTIAPATLTEGERKRQQRRSIAIALMLGGLVVLFYLVTIVRMGGSLAKRAI